MKAMFNVGATKIHMIVTLAYKPWSEWNCNFLTSVRAVTRFVVHKLHTDVHSYCTHNHSHCNWDVQRWLHTEYASSLSLKIFPGNVRIVTSWQEVRNISGIWKVVAVEWPAAD